MEIAQRQNLLRFYITLCLAEGLAALIWLTLAQTGSLSGFLAGFSLGRLALLAPCLLLVGALGWSTIILWKDRRKAEKWSQKIGSLAGGELFYWGILALSGGVLLAGIYLQAFAARTADSYLAMYHVRLAPYAWWGVILAIQTPVALRLLRYGASLDAFAPYRTTFRAFLIASGILLLLSIWMLVSGTGLRADAFGWGAPGVPILPSASGPGAGHCLRDVGAGWGACLPVAESGYQASSPAFQTQPGYPDLLAALAGRRVALGRRTAQARLFRHRSNAAQLRALPLLRLFRL